MSSEGSERQGHLRAITITSLAALAGVAAAIVSGYLTADLIAAGDTASLAAAAADTTAQIVVVAAIVVQIPVYQFVYDDWGGAKDVLFVAFMTFCLWFVTWGIILSSGAQLV